MRSRQQIRELMKEYTVLIGLLELADRPLGGDELKTSIGKDIQGYRKKVTDKERDLLAAFAKGYGEAKEAWAGLPELDTMREQFVQLQFRAHQGDSEHAAESRKQIISRCRRPRQGCPSMRCPPSRSTGWSNGA